MSRIHFFATHDDLLEVLSAVNDSCPLGFVELAAYNDPSDIFLKSLNDLGDISRSQTGDHLDNPHFVFLSEKTVQYKTVLLPDKTFSYHLDQSLNPDTVLLWPGGFYDKKTLVTGEINTISSSEESQKLFKLFRKMIRKRFMKVRNYYLGQEAYALSENLRLVTICLKSPPEYDFIVNISEPSSLP